jgi:hypothetical protein
MHASESRGLKATHPVSLNGRSNTDARIPASAIPAHFRPAGFSTTFAL